MVYLLSPTGIAYLSSQLQRIGTAKQYPAQGVEGVSRTSVVVVDGHYQIAQPLSRPTRQRRSGESQAVYQSGRVAARSRNLLQSSVGPLQLQHPQELHHNQSLVNQHVCPSAKIPQEGVEGDCPLAICPDYLVTHLLFLLLRRWEYKCPTLSSRVSCQPSYYCWNGRPYRNYELTSEATKDYDQGKLSTSFIQFNSILANINF